MVADVELWVIHPDGAAAAEWHRDHYLTKPRYSSDPPGEHCANCLEADARRSVEDQQHAELLTELSGVHRQECLIGWACPLDSWTAP
jgi:hypothetical protein